MTDRQAVSDAPAHVVVVATDGERLEQYASALRDAQIQSRATLDPDEAEALVADLSPNVLVLDRGLPRLVLFRLYGLVRDDVGEAPAQIVFVGQEGETGPDDHYLPGEPSPAAVAARVAQLVPSATATAAPAQPDAATDPGAVPVPGDTGEPTAAARQEEDASADAEPVAVETDAVDGVATATAPTQTTTASQDGAQSAELPEPADAAAPARRSRRLDVILIRVGFVLLILGALLFLIQTDVFPATLAVPDPPTPPPTASPEPSAFLDSAEAPGWVVVSLG